MDDPLARLSASMFEGDSLAVARRMVGRWLRAGPIILQITEVEAYREGDSANHCYRGRTARNAAMFGPPGTAYVYRCYGIHLLLNLVCGPAGVGTAVLVRAAQPVAGAEGVAARRGGRQGPDSLAGPGKLGAALQIDLALSGHDLCAPGGLEILAGRPARRLRLGPRIGIDYAAPADRAAPWRLADADSPWVSHPRRFTHEEEA